MRRNRPSRTRETKQAKQTKTSKGRPQAIPVPPAASNTRDLAGKTKQTQANAPTTGSPPKEGQFCWQLLLSSVTAKIWSIKTEICDLTIDLNTKLHKVIQLQDGRIAVSCFDTLRGLYLVGA